MTKSKFLTLIVRSSWKSKFNKNELIETDIQSLKFIGSKHNAKYYQCRIHKQGLSEIWLTRSIND